MAQLSLHPSFSAAIYGANPMMMHVISSSDTPMPLLSLTVGCHFYCSISIMKSRLQYGHKVLLFEWLLSVRSPPLVPCQSVRFEGIDMKH